MEDRINKLSESVNIFNTSMNKLSEAMSVLGEALVLTDVKSIYDQKMLAVDCIIENAITN